MFWFLLAILFGVVAFAFAVRARNEIEVPPSPAADTEPDELDLDGDATPPSPKRRRPRIPARPAAITFGVLAGIFFVLSFVRVVPPGNAGVPVTFGSVGGETGPGLKIVSPFTSFSNISTRTEQLTMTGSGGQDPAVGVLGKDGSSATADATLIFRVARKNASDIFKELGANYRDKVVRPTARACVRDAFRLYDIVEAATTQFGNVADGIDKCVREKLEPHGITVEDFQLRELTLSPKVKDALETELASLRVAGTLTPEFLQYLYIKALEQLASGPNDTTVVIPTDSNLTPVLPIDGDSVVTPTPPTTTAP